MTVEEQLAKLTNTIDKMVVQPVAAVAPVLPVAPVAPVLPINTQDHDLLQRLDGKVDGLKTDIQSINDGLAKTISDHENRLRTLESRVDTNNTQVRTYGSIGILLIGVIEFFLLKFFGK